MTSDNTARGQGAGRALASLTGIPMRRRGISTMYTAVAFVVLAGFVSMGVDMGRVQLAKTQLRSATDAAARAAVTGLCSSIALAQSRAVEIAAANLCDGQPVALDPARDIEFGTWHAPSATFTPLSGEARLNANAIRISAQRTRDRGNPVPLTFARIVGRSSCDIHASAVAMIRPGYPWGFIGLESFTVNNNLLAVGYDPSVNPNPSAQSNSGSAVIGSNGVITARNNTVVGAVLLGPSGSTDLSLSVPAVQLWQAIPTPGADFSAAPASNPGGTPRDYTVNGNRTLPAGDYYFTSLRLHNNASLSFTGPARLFIDGSVTFDQNGEIRAYNNYPENLQIFQRGAASRFGGPNANTVDVVAVITAPQTTFSTKNSAKWRGQAVFRSIDAKNNAELYYDRTLPDVWETINGGGDIALVE